MRPAVDTVGLMSPVPYLDDILGPDVDVITTKQAAALLAVPLSRLEQMVRDRQIIAFKRARVPVVPAVFIFEGRVLKGLSGTINLLLDGGYTESEIVRWLFADDATLPGTPIEALHGNRGKEVTRRAQSMAL